MATNNQADPDYIVTDDWPVGATVVTEGPAKQGGKVTEARIHGNQLEDSDRVYLIVSQPDGHTLTTTFAAVDRVNPSHVCGCSSCGAISDKTYRCENCDRDLVEEGNYPTSETARYHTTHER
ncbi:hypothetical protein RYH80_18300 [Halobaculum sp. MBLA0147]|uniref:hypothetical protein n=1 Tax=Halobaculum sp. MBLA0147 TaxID=3079934 RepID=UPI003524B773